MELHHLNRRMLLLGGVALAGLAAAYPALVTGSTLQLSPAPCMMAQAKSYQLHCPSQVP